MQVTNPLKGTKQPDDGTRVMNIHAKIKRNNPIKSITEHINPKLYKNKTKFNLPIGW